MSKFVDDVMCLAMAVDATAGLNARRALLSQLQAHLEAREAVTADLLEALKTLVPMFNEWHEHFPTDVGDKELPALQRARAAIAKAVRS